MKLKYSKFEKITMKVFRRENDLLVNPNYLNTSTFDSQYWAPIIFDYLYNHLTLSNIENKYLKKDEKINISNFGDQNYTKIVLLNFGININTKGLWNYENVVKKLHKFSSESVLDCIKQFVSNYEKKYFQNSNTNLVSESRKFSYGLLEEKPISYIENNELNINDNIDESLPNSLTSAKRKVRNEYYEISPNYQIELQSARSRNVDEIHEIFQNMKGYNRIDRHVIELEILNEKRRVAIFRLVPEGNADEKYIKRVQISQNDVKGNFADEVIVVYLIENAKKTIYFRIVGFTSNTFRIDSDTVTTLFRLNIHKILEVYRSPTVVRIAEVKVRGSENAYLLGSWDFNALFKNSDNLTEVDNLNKDYSFDVVQEDELKTNDLSSGVEQNDDEYEYVYDEDDDETTLPIDEPRDVSFKTTKPQVDILEAIGYNFDDENEENLIEPQNISLLDTIPFMKKMLVDKAKIGNMGERWVYDQLSDNTSEFFKFFEDRFGQSIENVNYQHLYTEQYTPYDLVINNVVFVEVKSSTSNLNQFFYSLNEKKFAEAHMGKYFLVKINFEKDMSVDVSRIKIYDSFQVANLEHVVSEYIVKE